MTKLAIVKSRTSDFDNWNVFLAASVLLQTAVGNGRRFRVLGHVTGVYASAQHPLWRRVSGAGLPVLWVSAQTDVVAQGGAQPFQKSGVSNGK